MKLDSSGHILIVTIVTSFFASCKARDSDLKASNQSQSIWKIEPSDRMGGECEILRYYNSSPSSLKNAQLFVDDGDLAIGQSVKIVAKPKQNSQSRARLVTALGKSIFIQQMQGDDRSVANPNYMTWVGYYGRSPTNDCQEL